MMVSYLKGKTCEERLVEANMTTLETRRFRGDLIQQVLELTPGKLLDFTMCFLRNHIPKHETTSSVSE